MINFIFDTTLYDKNGVKYRYDDFLLFLKKSNIKYNTVYNITDYRYNIVDLLYICDNSNFVINSSCYMFCGSSKKIMESKQYYNKHNIIPDYSKYISHNLYYANSFNGTFLPMFLYKNDTKMVNVNKKYKYGIFASCYDVTYLLYNKIFDTLDIDYNEILFMDNENCVNNKYNKTNDKNLFYSSIDTFLDFANDYSNRHVMSRTYLEIIANNIPIQIVSFNNSKPISFKGFSHIQYNKINEFTNFDLLDVIYEPKYFKIETYSDYIRYILNNLDKRIHLSSVEEYVNGTFSY